ncbi:pyruvate dehydrogenase (acetyl-transferring) E1 component subunit alpha [Lentzea albida]|uniref:Pyruvate dehydrogenase E1 component subunit alpha n=1 Tax=Lentzea albida TaxID=65499 RepID=A0A1H9RDT0_9PSEU|nr:pyruvate dehydrogenase (acetyl-transferring) E1 component subunit alpha [Lentzea albida]SER70834.1 pyruvate dehydrogenase E1 component alpha subunit [Lentzea albida]
MKEELELLRQMVRIRRFEERCAELYSSAQIRGFLHLYVGEEAVATGVLSELDPQDSVVSTYRDHGHALARGVPMDAVMAEMFGKVTGCSRGRGGSMHLFDASHRLFGGNAIVGGGLPIAAGLALGHLMRGEPRVVACFFGEGAAAEGEFHEVLNLSALWRLPVLFCCENNQYAMGTAFAKEHAAADLALRAGSYGLAAWSVDGMDVLAVKESARRAAEEIRAGGGPCLLELRTYRFRAHSMYDPERYRDKEEVAHWRDLDPIDRLRNAMRPEFTDDDLAALEAEVAAEIDLAVATAEAADVEPVADLTRFVTSEVTP